MPKPIEHANIVAESKPRAIVPAEEFWDMWFARPGVSPDFMETRDQPADQERVSMSHSHARLHAERQ